MSEIKVILFDLDGTLVDTKNLIIASFQRATEEVLGITAPAETIRKMIGIPLKTAMIDIAGERTEELMSAYQVHNQALHNEMIRYFDGTKEMLDELHEQGYRLGVVTSKRHDPAMQALESFNMQENFELLLGMDDFPIHKPRPEPLLKAAELMGLLAGEPCVYIGDSPYDMQAAVAAKMYAVAARWGMFTREELQEGGAQYEANTPRDIPGIVASL